MNNCIFTFFYILDQHLVSGRRILSDSDLASVHFDGFALAEGSQTDHDAVNGIDFDDSLFHDLLILIFGLL